MALFLLSPESLALAEREHKQFDNVKVRCYSTPHRPLLITISNWVYLYTLACPSGTTSCM